MGLRAQQEADLAEILEDPNDWGWPITVTGPNGDSASFVGSSTDIGQIFDPDTGQAVSGRLASVALRISSLIAAGLSIPAGIADASIKPWLVEFDDINGNSYTFKVSKSHPDRAAGIVTCVVELYQ